MIQLQAHKHMLNALSILLLPVLSENTASKHLLTVLTGLCLLLATAATTSGNTSRQLPCVLNCLPLLQDTATPTQ